MEDRIRTLHYREPDVRPPLDVGDVLRTSLRLLIAHPWLVLGVAVFGVLPSTLIEMFRSEATTSLEAMGASPGVLAVTLFEMLVTPAGVGAVTVLIAVAAHTGRVFVPRDAARRIGTRLGAAIAGSTLSIFASVLGLMLCIVPGIVATLALALVVSVNVAEETGAIAALPRSAELTKGIRLPLLAIMVVTMLPSVVSYIALDAVLGAGWKANATTSLLHAALVIPSVFFPAVSTTWISLAAGVVYARAAIVPSETHVADVAAVFA